MQATSLAENPVRGAPRCPTTPPSFLSAVVDHFWRHDGHYVWGSAVLWSPNLPCEAAHAGVGPNEFWKILYTGEDIQRGQNVWQSIGGMQQGSIWVMEAT